MPDLGTITAAKTRRGLVCLIVPRWPTPLATGGDGRARRPFAAVGAVAGAATDNKPVRTVSGDSVGWPEVEAISHGSQPATRLDRAGQARDVAMGPACCAFAARRVGGDMFDTSR